MHQTMEATKLIIRWTENLNIIWIICTKWKQTKKRRGGETSWTKVFYTSMFFRMQTVNPSGLRVTFSISISALNFWLTFDLSFWLSVFLLLARTFVTLSASFICFLAGYADIHRSWRGRLSPSRCSERSCDPSPLHPRCVKLRSGSNHNSLKTTFEVRARNNGPSTPALYWTLQIKWKTRYFFIDPVKAKRAFCLRNDISILKYWWDMKSVNYFFKLSSEMHKNTYTYTRMCKPVYPY